MSFDREKELATRKDVSNMLDGVTEIDFVVPAAHYFKDIADFWNQYAPKSTQKDIETTLIKACWIYPTNFRNEFIGNADAPKKHVDYEFYWFVQYGLQREDEGVDPDVFEKLVLRQHNDFIGGWLGLQEAFDRRATIAGLSADEFSIRQSTPLVQTEPIIPMAVCEFIPRAVGYAVRLRETIEVKTKDC